jgi:hypothetical protein
LAIEKRRAQAAKRAEALAAERTSDDWVDLVVEMDRVTHERHDEWPEAGDPAWPETYRGEYIAAIRAGSLAPDRGVYYVRVKRPVAIRMLRDTQIAGGYLATSWSDLYESGYEYNAQVFQGDAEFVSVTGKADRITGKVADLQPGSRLLSVRPPSVFDREAPDLAIERARQWIPNGPDAGDLPGAPDDERHYFFVANTGVALGGSQVIDCGEGVRWWSPLAYPGSAHIQQMLGSHPSLQSESRPIASVVTAERRPHIEWDTDFDRARRMVYRLRVLLNLLHGASPVVIGHYSVKERRRGATNLTQEVYTGIRYRHRSHRFWSGPRVLAPDMLREASAVATAGARKKKLLYHLQRALDSLDLARSLWDDPPVALLLIWAAIEALLSPSDRVELSANIALALLALGGDGDRVGLFDEIRASYAVRSKVVHNFEVPEPKEMDAALELAATQAARAIRYAIRTGLPSGQTRDQMMTALRAAALRGVSVVRVPPTKSRS